MMESRVCIVPKLVWAEMLQAMPPETRALSGADEVGAGNDTGQTAIVLYSPFEYRLLFIIDKEKP